jgi:mRNA interferase RelE/StbE
MIQPRKYTLVYNKHAKDDLDNLREPFKSTIKKALERLIANPWIGKILKGNFKDLFSYRVGDHRIIYQLEHQKILIIILKISHRRDVYR